MPRRRRGAANELITIYWIDIPAQITAQAGDQKVKAMLTDRFQHAIDRAAAVADKTETQAYVAEWRRVARPLDGGADDVQAEVDAEAARLEAAFPRERLEAFVANGGADPEPPSESNPSEAPQP